MRRRGGVGLGSWQVLCLVLLELQAFLAAVAQVLPDQNYTYLLHVDVHGRCELNATLMNIYTKERCEEAAAALGLPDTSVPEGVDYDDLEGTKPYGCYYQNNFGASGSLYFNNDTRDLGNDDCGSYCDSICTDREGCTNSSFMEYDPHAVRDDGSCRIPVQVLHLDDGVCPMTSTYFDFLGNTTEVWCLNLVRMRVVLIQRATRIRMC